MNSGIFVAKHLQALFEKPEFVADMRDAARYRYNARFLIRANEVAGTDGDIVLFVAYRGIILVLAALDVKPVDNAVSAQTMNISANHTATMTSSYSLGIPRFSPD